MLAGGCPKLPKECSNITSKHTHILSMPRISHIVFRWNENAVWSLAINYTYNRAKCTFLGMTAIKSTICDNERHPWIAANSSHTRISLIWDICVASLNLDISPGLYLSLALCLAVALFELATNVQITLWRTLWVEEIIKTRRKAECYLRVVTIKTTKRMWYLLCARLNDHVEFGAMWPKKASTERIVVLLLLLSISSQNEKKRTEKKRRENDYSTNIKFNLFAQNAATLFTACSSTTMLAGFIFTQV